ncbi:MAG: hypothetical protein V3V18_11515 [Methylococcales bacterium]
MTATVTAQFTPNLFAETKKPGHAMHGSAGGLSSDDHRGRRGCGQGTATTTSSTVTQTSMAEQANIDATQVTL